LDAGGFIFNEPLGGDSAAMPPAAASRHKLEFAKINQLCKPVSDLIGSRVETGIFQAYGSTGFDLCRVPATAATMALRKECIAAAAAEDTARRAAFMERARSVGAFNRPLHRLT
jgi:hypothetical protein